MLIVMEDRQHLKAVEPFLNVEAFRRFDVFQVDRVEVAQQFDDGLDCLLGAGTRVHADWNDLHVTEQLEQQRLSFHDGEASARSDVAIS